ncbi:MAG: GTPase [Candidatus Nanohaloarchaea archaeon]|nr:GTPase [Candidatus Nanohaloarchaea archaeon]
MGTVVILGAAGRDYHDFLSVFKQDEDHDVVAFVQVEGQNVAELDEFPDRAFPASLAGDQYDEDIPIRPESELEQIIADHGVDEVVLSYSDASHEEVMHQASRVLATGASFRLVGPDDMMLEAETPVVAVDAVRTGAGKSQASQKITDLLEERGLEVVVVREPMPYGDLASAAVQRFETHEDLDDADVTIEEREEYERHIDRGHVVYAGVDYAAILDRVEQEADIILWEGGNNELPFFRPDLHVVLADPVRPGDERAYHPGETNLRMADYVVINKENSAEQSAIDTVAANVGQVNPDAEIVHADSVVTVEDPSLIEGKRVLVVEDGPTVTHGGTASGAGRIAAEKYGATEIVDPADSATGSLEQVLDTYELDRVLPAMGYSEEQRRELEQSITAADCDAVVAGTPIDLAGVIDVDTPVVNVEYRIANEEPAFSDILDRHSSVLGVER